jgi:hypothetical protein
MSFELDEPSEVYVVRWMVARKPPDARGVESVWLEACCRGWQGLLPQVQASAKAPEALTDDGRAGKQREKNGARLT